MTRWISLSPDWRLQDVQAGLNVIVAFLCAGGVFVLVRHFWISAARKVIHHKTVPAYLLLSLNTVGETIDVIWLLKRDLLCSRQYWGLLVQCICVLVLTITALLSGLIARYSTREGTTIVQRAISGNIAERSQISVPFAYAETNLTFSKLQRATFPPTQLLEFWPDAASNWEYNRGQWNGSWSMDCQYEEPTPLSNPYATGNCTDFLWSELPEVKDKWTDFNDGKSSYSYDSTGWRNEPSSYHSFLIFVHGVQPTEWDQNLSLALNVRTVAYFISGAPYSDDIPEDCNWAEGPLAEATYTSFTCKLRRQLGSRSTGDLALWGAYPESYFVPTQTGAYLQHYGNTVRQRASQYLPIQPIDGTELVQFYQAYMAVKDTAAGVSQIVTRTLDVRVPVPQVSLTTLIICGVAAVAVLGGLMNYFVFIYRHWGRLDQTPQSKLDWMLQTLRMENEEGDQRAKFECAMAEAAPTQSMRAAMLGSDHGGSKHESAATTTATDHRGQPLTSASPEERHSGFERSSLLQ